jgi:hypothetical protein
MRGLTKAIVFCALALVIVLPAQAAPPSPSNEAGHDVLGLVPAKHLYAAKGGGGSNLVYHGGPVMRTNRTYAIYWLPTASSFTMAPGYQTTINQYFTDVAAAKNATNNVYGVLTQYYDTLSGSATFIQNDSTFGGGFVDGNAYPASGCSDPVAATSVCLTDAQLANEVNSFVSSHGLPRGTSTLYLIFTARGVGSCFDPSACAFSYYCAYHTHFGSGSGVTLWANQPYTMTVPSACDAGYHPNGSNDADGTINVASHEHREAMNDQQGNAWYDRRGYEGSDKCAWNFGALTGPNYNQTINGHHYILQQEWSNSGSTCKLHA